MVKFILGLVSLGGVSLAGLYMYTGFESGSTGQSGSCCHGRAPAVSAAASQTPAEGGTCCSMPSRARATVKFTCCDESAKTVEVLTVAPREVASK